MELEVETDTALPLLVILVLLVENWTLVRPVLLRSLKALVSGQL